MFDDQTRDSRYVSERAKCRQLLQLLRLHLLQFPNPLRDHAVSECDRSQITQLAARLEHASSCFNDDEAIETVDRNPEPRPLQLAPHPPASHPAADTPNESARHGRRRLCPVVVCSAVFLIAASIYATSPHSPFAPQPAEVVCPVTRQRMVRVPAGRVRLGSNADEIATVLSSLEFSDLATDRINSELGLGDADVSAIYVAQTPVTVRQFRQFVVATNHITRSEIMRGQGRDGDTWIRSHDYHWDDLGDVEADDRRPVVNVTFRDAVAYCEWLSDETGHTYRLPTEAEWTHAARAGSATMWACGNDLADTLSHGWTASNAGGRPHPVGQFAPNAFGIHDTLGGVWEWVDGHFDPQKPFRLAKGGSWRTTPWLARPACRMGVRDTFISAAVGFRVVREIHRR